MGRYAKPASGLGGLVRHRSSSYLEVTMGSRRYVAVSVCDQFQHRDNSQSLLDRRARRVIGSSCGSAVRLMDLENSRVRWPCHLAFSR